MKPTPPFLRRRAERAKSIKLQERVLRYSEALHAGNVLIARQKPTIPGAEHLSAEQISEYEADFNAYLDKFRAKHDLKGHAENCSNVHSLPAIFCRCRNATTPSEIADWNPPLFPLPGGCSEPCDTTGKQALRKVASFLQGVLGFFGLECSIKFSRSEGK